MNNGMKENMEDIADDASTFLHSATGMTQDELGEARERLSQMLDQVRDAYEAVQEKAVEYTKATDKAIRRNPYPAIGIAAGIGILVGFLITRRR